MIRVTGKTIDNTGALPWVNIFELGTSNSTQSDDNGNFAIDVNNAASQLKFSFVGYAPVTLTASEVLFGKIVELAVDSELLNEVVVPGKPKPKNGFPWLGVLIVGGLVVTYVKLSGTEPEKPKKTALKKPKKTKKQGLKEPKEVVL